MCAYSVGIHWTEDNLNRLIDEVDQIKWNIAGSCEAYRKGQRLSEIWGGYWLYEISKTEDNPDAKGLAFLIYAKTKDCVTDFNAYYSNRVISLEVNLQGKDSVTVINAYAPTSSAEEEKGDRFYDDIERAMSHYMSHGDSKYKIMTGDFNAKK